MKRIKKPAGDKPAGTDRDRTKNGQKSKTKCTTYTKPLSSTPPVDNLALMHLTAAAYLEAFSAFLKEIEGAKNG